MTTRRGAGPGQRFLRLGMLGSLLWTVGCNLLVPAPKSVTYPATEVTAKVGVPVAPLTPTITGGTPRVFKIEPSLPPGLQLDASSGRLSGTPTKDAPRATYQVVAWNPGGSAVTTLSIAVTGGCDPRTYEEWVAAKDRGCLTRDAVCEKALMSRLLEDPVFMSASARGGQGGGDSSLYATSAFFARLREQHDCPQDPNGRPQRNAAAKGVP